MSGGLYGDWDKAIQMIDGWQKNLKRALHKALLQEGEFLRAQIILGISSGAPGGEKFAPRSQLTTAFMKVTGHGGYTNTLIRSGDLRNSVTVVPKGDAVFVGILRQTRGRSNLYNLASIHEFGRTFLVQWTAKSRAWFFAMMRKAGIEVNPARRLPAPRGMRLVRIPARPFLGPVFKKYMGNHAAAVDRYMGRVVKLLKRYAR